MNFRILPAVTAVVVVERAVGRKGAAERERRAGAVTVAIGVEIHEPPYLDGGSDVVMEAGMCFTNEPGIYQPGKFGLRVEDICYLTEDGADHFGIWQDGPGAP